MIVFPSLSMNVLKKDYLPILEDKIAEARDKKTAQVTLTMHVDDAEVLKWLISSFQVAKASMEVSLEMLKQYPDYYDDIIHEMQEEANKKIIHHLQEKNYIRTFSDEDGTRNVKRISQQLCVVSYPLPGDIKKGD